MSVSSTFEKAGTLDESRSLLDERSARRRGRMPRPSAKPNAGSTCRPIREASVHGPAHAQDFEKTVVALARLGVFSVDLVERALLDEGEDMVLLLSKAAGCSWTTARELLLMYAANRSLKPDDMTRAFERYKKLSQETARNIVNFYERRMNLRAKADEKNKSARGQKDVANNTVDDDIVVVPSPSIHLTD